MKNRFLILLAIVAMLFACSEDSTFTDLTKSAEQTKQNSELIKGNNGKAVTKTIKIRGSGIVKHTFLYDDSDGNQIYYAEVHGEGNASHLGLFTIDLHYYAISPDLFPISPIEGIQTAANGDNLITTAFGPNPDGSIRFYYNKGTGRFENVTGYVDLFFEWEDTSYTNYGVGEITY